MSGDREFVVSSDRSLAFRTTVIGVVVITKCYKLVHERRFTFN